MSRCEEYEVLLSGQLDGDLNPEEEARLQTHLETCPQCRARQRELAALHGLMQSMRAEPPEDLTDKILSSLPPVEKKKRRGPLPWVAVCAASVALVAAVWSAGTFLLPGSSSNATDRETAEAVHAEEPAEAAAESDSSWDDGFFEPEEAAPAPESAEMTENTETAEAFPEDMTEGDAGASIRPLPAEFAEKDADAATDPAEDVQEASREESAPPSLSREQAAGILSDWLEAQGRGGLTPLFVSGSQSQDQWVFVLEETGEQFAVLRPSGEVLPLPSGTE